MTEFIRMSRESLKAYSTAYASSLQDAIKAIPSSSYLNMYTKEIRSFQYLYPEFFLCFVAEMIYKTWGKRDVLLISGETEKSYIFGLTANEIEPVKKFIDIDIKENTAHWQCSLQTEVDSYIDVKKVEFLTKNFNMVDVKSKNNKEYVQDVLDERIYNVVFWENFVIQLLLDNLNGFNVNPNTEKQYIELHKPISESLILFLYIDKSMFDINLLLRNMGFAILDIGFGLKINGGKRLGGFELLPIETNFMREIMSNKKLPTLNKEESIYAVYAKIKTYTYLLNAVISDITLFLVGDHCPQW